MAGTALHQGGGGKGRRVGGRRDEMQGGVHYAVSAQEDDMVIKQRLVTRTTTTRGEPPLKRLQKRFVGFVSEIEKDADNVSDCDRLYKSLLQEITTFELPLLRTQSVTDAHKREKENFTVLQGELHHQILQAQSDIEALKQQLEDSQVERRHKEECEAIRRLIGGQPPRVETQKTISQLEKELSCLEAQNTASTRTLELRKKQFYLLLHVVEELQNAMDEEQRTITEEMRSALEEKSSIGEPSGALPAIDAVIANQPEAMQIG